MRGYFCDACGNQYKPYVTKVADGEIGVEANGMTFVKIDKSGNLHNKGRMELCPECMEKLQCFIFDDLTNENSPYVDKVKRYLDRKAKEEAENNKSESVDES